MSYYILIAIIIISFSLLIFLAARATRYVCRLTPDWPEPPRIEAPYIDDLYLMPLPKIKKIVKLSNEATKEETHEVKRKFRDFGIDALVIAGPIQVQDLQPRRKKKFRPVLKKRVKVK